MDTQTVTTIVGIVVGVILVAVFPGALMYLAARAYLSPDARVETLDPETHKQFLDATRDVGLWAERHGWRWVGAYAYPANTFAETLLEAWQTPGLDRYLIAFRHKMKPNALYLEFMTLFDDANHLDTLTSRDDLLVPDVPGRFMQVFPDEPDLDRLWALHQQGEHWAASSFGLTPRHAGEDFETMWRDGASRVLRGLMAKPLWIVRVWLWYPRTLTLAGKPVSSRRGLRPAMQLAD